MKKILLGAALLIPGIALFSVAHGVAITASIPGKYDLAATGAVPGQFVYNIYQYALGLAGIIAFGVVVFGGVKYMISAGNPSGQTDAKDWIKAALMGVLLLAGAYFILNVINPQLTNLALPVLTPVNIQSPSTGSATPSSSCGACGSSCKTGTCSTDQHCKDGVCKSNQA